MGTFPFRGGVPTRPDVDKLVKKFGVPTIGSVVPYADMEKELGFPRHTARWIAVIGAWKRRMYREHNLWFETMQNQGYRVAPADTRIMHSGKKVKTGIKHVIKGGELAARTGDDGLTPDGKKARDHIILTAGKLASIANMAAKQIDWPI